MKIVFMGSADFGICALETLMEYHEIVGVVSTPAKPKGRGLKTIDSPITSFARNRNIEPILTPKDLNDTDLIKTLSDLKADLFVVVAFRILPESVFSIPPFGTINIHASLLPLYRGPAPIQRAIEAGESETGVTIFRIDKGIDTGQIIFQKKIPIDSQETTPELYMRLSRLGAKALIESIDMIKKGIVTPKGQDNSNATNAPKLSKKEAKIDWSQSNTEIFNKIRAFKPFPGTFMIMNGKRIAVEWAYPLNEGTSKKPGTVVKTGSDFIDVQCGKGVLRIIRIKPEGKREMSIHDFLLGTKIPEGIILH